MRMGGREGREGGQQGREGRGRKGREGRRRKGGRGGKERRGGRGGEGKAGREGRGRKGRGEEGKRQSQSEIHGECTKSIQAVHVKHRVQTPADNLQAKEYLASQKPVPNILHAHPTA